MTDLPVLILIAVYTETNRKVLINFILKSLVHNTKKLLVVLELHYSANILIYFSLFLDENLYSPIRVFPDHY